MCTALNRTVAESSVADTFGSVSVTAPRVTLLVSFAASLSQAEFYLQTRPRPTSPFWQHWRSLSRHIQCSKLAPPWKVIVQRQEDHPIFEDISLYFHHALFDGSSARAFHEHLLEQFIPLPPNPISPDILSFPDPPSLPETQETVLAYQTSLFSWASGLWRIFRPDFLTDPIWAGNPISVAAPRESCVRALDLSTPIV